MHKRSATVVLVGRPNVGKSTLFNRLTRSRRAIVTAIPGTTRDVMSQTVEWQDVVFDLVDTGGMFGHSPDPLHALVVAKGRQAIAAADLVVFIVDGREGLVPGDQEIAQVLRGAGVTTLLAINKTDDHRARSGAMEFYQLNFDEVHEISAEHGQGIGELLEAITARLPRVERVPSEAGAAAALPAAADIPQAPKGSRTSQPERAAETSVAIVGRPNAGKSSLVNRMLREERMIVSEVPGTTRDSVDTLLKWHRRQFRIIDTAGIRRPGRVAKSGQVESISVLLAQRSIENAGIVVLVIDAVQGATDQDAAIAGEADKAGAGIIIAANKWDLMKDKGPDTAKLFDEKLRDQLKFLDYAPILHISAVTGERTPKLLETIDRVSEARRKRITTGELNRFIAAVTAAHPPASPGRRHVRIMYAAQTGIEPPTFVMFTNVATEFHFSYERFLVNQIRDAFGFHGSPIRVQVRRRAGRGKEA